MSVLHAPCRLRPGTRYLICVPRTLSYASLAPWVGCQCSMLLVCVYPFRCSVLCSRGHEGNLVTRKVHWQSEVSVRASKCKSLHERNAEAGGKAQVQRPEGRKKSLLVNANACGLGKPNVEQAEGMHGQVMRRRLPDLRAETHVNKSARCFKMPSHRWDGAIWSKFARASARLRCSMRMDCC